MTGGAKGWAACAAALAAGLLLFHGATFKGFPVVDSDEAMEANHSYNILRRGENVYSLYEDIFPPKFDAMVHSLPNVLRPIYNGALAAVFKIAGVGPWSGRAFSSFCSLLSLLLIACLVWRWTGSRWAVLGVCAVLGFNAVFTLSAHETRPEAMLGLFACLIFFLLDGAAEDWRLAAAAGLAAGLAPGVHTNGAGVALAALAVLVLRAPSRWLPFGIGAAAGGTVVAALVRPDVFLPGWIVFDGFFSYRPPISEWRWNLAAQIGMEIRRYVSPSLLSHETVGTVLHRVFRVEWALVSGAWLSSWWLYKDQRMRSLLLWTGNLFFFFALFVANKNVNYASLFEPFFALLLVVFIHRSLEKRPRQWSLGALLLPCFLGALLLGLGSAVFLTPLFFLFALAPLELPREKRFLFVLLTLVPLFCLRVFAPEAFTASLKDGWSLLHNLPAAAAFLFAAAVLVFSRTRNPKSRPPAGAWLGLSMVLVLAVLTFLQVREVVNRSQRAVPFDTIAEELRAAVSGGRVLGPPIVWLAFKDEDYRDWNGLSYARWLTGREDITPYAAAWRPDYLITDRNFKEIFLRHKPMSEVLRVPAEKVAEIRGRGFAQPIEVFRLDWSGSAAHGG